MTELLEAAISYAQRGWPVFPVHSPVDGGCSCGEAACDNVGKHPRTPHGLNDASTDVDVIRSWWQRWPAANIGLRTGIAFDVLDIDSDEAGRALAIAADLAGEETTACWAGGPMSNTARGTHVLYLPTGSGNAANLLGIKGADWRGAGGYVVAPPSLHRSGVRYAWASTNPPTFELEPAPVFLVAALLNLPAKVAPLRSGTPRGIIAGLVEFVVGQVEGSRNNGLNWAAHTLGTHVYRGELSEDDGRRGAEVLLDAALRAGLGELEAKATIASGWAAGRSGRIARSAS